MDDKKENDGTCHRGTRMSVLSISPTQAKRPYAVGRYFLCNAEKSGENWS
jgi:hypothetical protein